MAPKGGAAERSRLLVDEFQRVRDAVYPAANALDDGELAYRPDAESNSIAWLVWHLSRQQDRVVSSLSGLEPVWTATGWFDRFGLALDPTDTGYGHDSVTAGTVTSTADLLLGYFEDVHRRTVAWVGSLDDDALSKVLDETTVPPVTVESRLVGAIVDDLQHAGQAAYLRGIAQRR